MSITSDFQKVQRNCFPLFLKYLIQGKLESFNYVFTSSSDTFLFIQDLVTMVDYDFVTLNFSYSKRKKETKLSRKKS